MSWTTSDLEAIDSAIKSGRLRVRYGDRDVTYRSLDEMLRIRDLINHELGLVADGGRTVRYSTYSKGL